MNPRRSLMLEMVDRDRYQSESLGFGECLLTLFTGSI
jgi:hypothetical protein